MACLIILAADGTAGQTPAACYNGWHMPGVELPTQSYPDTELERIILAEGLVREDPLLQMRTMDQVADHLGEVGLDHMRPGVLGYRVVTRQVYEAMAEDRFEYPEKFEQTIPEFAGLFYRALLRHIEGRPELIPGHWHNPMYSRQARRAGSGLQMWHFWRGHIPDLTKALLLTDTQDHHKDDYDRIDGVLAESTAKVMAEIKVDPNAVGRLGVWMVMYDVYQMRKQQWPAFKRYQALGITSDQARELVLPGDVRYDTVRQLAQSVGGITMKYAGTR